MSVITLLTDFGTMDEYVGVIKGVILGLAPCATLVDLTHEIEPQDILQGAYILNAAVDYFPSGTIHLAVIDPGVGGPRSAIAVRQGQQIFIAPNNGVLSLIVSKGFDQAVYIENRAMFQKKVSNTFHGRDIFAPIAAHLHNGSKMAELGTPVPAEKLIKIEPVIPEHFTASTLEGCVVAIDRFGNLMTNLSSETLRLFCARHPGKRLGVKVNKVLIPDIIESYYQVAPKSLLAVIGSRGYLEISVNMGNAAKKLNLAKGERVIVTLLNP